MSMFIFFLKPLNLLFKILFLIIIPCQLFHECFHWERDLLLPTCTQRAVVAALSPHAMSKTLANASYVQSSLGSSRLMSPNPAPHGGADSGNDSGPAVSDNHGSTLQTPPLSNSAPFLAIETSQPSPFTIDLQVQLPLPPLVSKHPMQTRSKFGI